LVSGAFNNLGTPKVVTEYYVRFDDSDVMVESAFVVCTPGYELLVTANHPRYDFPKNDFVFICNRN
jgi:hypothetical protein